MVNSDDFAKRLQIVFDFYNLNASSFAEKIGVGRASISHILSGRNKPSLDFVMKIISEFPEVELYWLLNGKGYFPKSEVKPTSSSIPFNSTIASDKDKVLNNEEEQTTTSKDPHHPTNKLINTSLVNKEIAKVLVLYTDGSFDSFTPNE